LEDEGDEPIPLVGLAAIAPLSMERNGECQRTLIANRTMEMPIGSFAMNRRWLVIDIFVVLLFVAIGRANHHHGDSLSGMVSTTWPFALDSRWAGSSCSFVVKTVPLSAAGVEAWLATVALG